MAVSTHLAPLRRIHIFAGLLDRELANVAKLITLTRADAGRVLFEDYEIARQAVFLIEGRIRVEHTDRTEAWLEPGETVGARSLVEGQCINSRVVCETECILGVTTPAEFATILRDFPHLRTAVLAPKTRSLEPAGPPVA